MLCCRIILGELIMAEKEEKQISGKKLDSFLEKNRKLLVIILIAIVVCLTGFIIAVSVSANQKEKNLSRIDEISFTMTDGSQSLEEGELTARKIDALDKLQELVNKSGIAGARANLLCAEISFQMEKYEDALNYWKAAANKSKKTYIEPIAYYQIAVCYEQLGNAEEAAVNYKLAAESKDFALACHAKFSYGRVLESLGKTEEAIAVYTELNDSNPTDDWAKLAKSRLVSLKNSK